MYPGIADRMQKEITALAPSSMKVISHILPQLLMNRLKLLLHLNVSIPSGLVDLSLHLFPPSNKCGSRNKSMMRVVLLLSTGSQFIVCKILIFLGSASRHIGPAYGYYGLCFFALWFFFHT